MRQVRKGYGVLGVVMLRKEMKEDRTDRGCGGVCMVMLMPRKGVGGRRHAVET